MFTVSLVILVITAEGIAWTYLYEKNATLAERIGAGIAIGMVTLGTIEWVIGMTGGIGVRTTLVSAAICSLPLVVLRRQFAYGFRRDLRRAGLFIHRAWVRLDTKIFFCGAAFLCFGMLLFFFFDRAMLEMNDGAIGTGAANNLGDLPYHIRVINRFVLGVGFPFENPIFSDAGFTYPFITDLVAASFVVLGISIRNAMLVQNCLLVLSTLLLTHRFTREVTSDKLAAALSPFLFLLNGGLGFLLYFGDAAASEDGIFGHLWSLTTDYTLRGGSILRWGNALTVLLVTQRTLLLSIPIALIIFIRFWKIFKDKKHSDKNADTFLPIGVGSFETLLRSEKYRSIFLIGAMAGLLPLIHAHTFGVVMIVAATLAIMRWKKWREWLVFFVSAAIPAIPELIFAMSRSGVNAGSFVGWEFGWDNGEHNVIWFWFVNTGLVIPLLIACIWGLKQSDSLSAESDGDRQRVSPGTLLLFYVPFAVCFLMPNLVRLAPWVWDNIKVLEFWYLGSVPLIALLLARLWRGSLFSRSLACGLLVCLTLTGFLDVWRVASRQEEQGIISPSMVDVARQLNEKVRDRSGVMVTAPEYATVPVLTGDRWFMGYTGHVWSHGLLAHDRENLVRAIYAGGDEARELIERYGIHYVLVGPQEKNFTRVNESFFKEYPEAASSGEYKVYQVAAQTR